MPEITEQELKKQIEKSSFARLYFLYGEEKYMVEHFAQKLIAKAASEANRNIRKISLRYSA